MSEKNGDSTYRASCRSVPHISCGIPYTRNTGCKSHAKEDKCLHLDSLQTGHTLAESHPCEPTENIWVGESKPVGRQHGSRGSLERASLHTWPQPHSEYSSGFMCMGSCIHSQKTHNCRLIVSQGAQSSLGDAPRSSLWASPETAWYRDPPALRRILVYTEAYLPIGEA